MWRVGERKPGWTPQTDTGRGNTLVNKQTHLGQPKKEDRARSGALVSTIQVESYGKHSNRVQLCTVNRFGFPPEAVHS